MRGTYWAWIFKDWPAVREDITAAEYFSPQVLFHSAEAAKLAAFENWEDACSGELADPLVWEEDEDGSITADLGNERYYVVYELTVSSLA